jgi:hypothetical protein
MGAAGGHQQAQARPASGAASTLVRRPGGAAGAPSLWTRKRSPNSRKRPWAEPSWPVRRTFSILCPRAIHCCCAASWRTRRADGNLVRRNGVWFLTRRLSGSGERLGRGGAQQGPPDQRSRTGGDVRHCLVRAGPCRRTGHAGGQGHRAGVDGQPAGGLHQRIRQPPQNVAPHVQ